MDFLHFRRYNNFILIFKGSVADFAAIFKKEEFKTEEFKTEDFKTEGIKLERKG